MTNSKHTPFERKLDIRVPNDLVQRTLAQARERNIVVYTYHGCPDDVVLKAGDTYRETTGRTFVVLEEYRSSSRWYRIVELRNVEGIEECFPRDLHPDLYSLSNNAP